MMFWRAFCVGGYSSVDKHALCKSHKVVFISFVRVHCTVVESNNSPHKYYLY